MVSLRVKRTLGHTKIGLLWGFNLKLPKSIPAAPFIGDSPWGLPVFSCFRLTLFLNRITLCSARKYPYPPPPPPPTEVKGNSTPASRLPSLTRKTGKDRARSTSYKSKASQSWYFIRKQWVPKCIYYLTVLCHTTLKLTGEQKFWVTAIVASKLMTTCHQPPGINTVSPGQWRISSFNENRNRNILRHRTKSVLIRWCYTGRFATTTFIAKQRCNVGTMLQRFETMS